MFTKGFFEIINLASYKHVKHKSFKIIITHITIKMSLCIIIIIIKMYMICI